MTRQVGCWVVLGLLAGAGPLWAQNSSWEEAPRQPPQVRQPAYPDQPMIPQDPTIQRRPSGQDYGGPERSQRFEGPAGMDARGPGPTGPNRAPMGPPAGNPAQPLPEPFRLTPQEEANLDRILLFWQQSSANVKTFTCKFQRAEFDPADPLLKPGQPRAVDKGEIRYAAPDKALFRVDDQNGQSAERWVSDGKAIYEFDPVKKQMIVHKLPPEMQGKAIAEGPVPFLFGAKAAHLKGRYYVQIIPDLTNKNQIGLEAWPRYQVDAQNFKYCELILAIGEKSLTPTAVRIHHPNGKQYVVYTLMGIAINQKDIRGVFEDPFRPRAPRGWQTVVEEPPPTPRNEQEPRPGGPVPTVGVRPVAPR